jgi:heterodisulfide reductase subunit A-like polyferredoxin
VNYLISKKLDWPYPLKLNTTDEMKTEVLILGGGIAGCFTAIAAAKNGESKTSQIIF